MASLYRAALAAGIRRTARSVRATLRPLVATSRRGTVAHLDGWRLRVPAATATDRPSAAAWAERVTSALAAGGLEPFVVERTGPGLVVGLEGQPRVAALRALRAALGEPNWVVIWEVGNRRVVSTLAGRRAARLARRAHTWRLFRATAAGTHVLGAEQAVHLTFWSLGTSGQLERMGTRGNTRFDARSAVTVEHVDGHDLPGRAAFPVAASLDHFDAPVDIVFTWVDDEDPEWRAAFAQWRGEQPATTREALDRARFRSRDELRYAMRSVWWHCPWVRNVYVVTAGHRPAWLTDHPNVRVVRHDEILPAEVLPTFNSHAIESVLHLIDGLAEHFVYFNDDMFIGRPVTPELFFTPSGLTRVFLSDARIPGHLDADALGVDAGAVRTRDLLSALGRRPVHKPLHSPYVLTRSLMAAISTEFADAVARTRAARFRSVTDVSTAASLAQHYALATGAGVPGEIRTEYATVESHRLAWHLRRIAWGRDVDSFCINATSDRGEADRHADERIARFLADYFPVPAPWERA